MSDTLKLKATPKLLKIAKRIGFIPKRKLIEVLNKEEVRPIKSCRYKWGVVSVYAVDEGLKFHHTNIIVTVGTKVAKKASQRVKIRRKIKNLIWPLASGKAVIVWVKVYNLPLSNLSKIKKCLESLEI